MSFTDFYRSATVRLRKAPISLDPNLTNSAIGLGMAAELPWTQPGHQHRLLPIVTGHLLREFYQSALKAYQVSHWVAADGYTNAPSRRLTCVWINHVIFYLLGGGGWLRRTVEFTQPTLAQTVVFDPWWGYFGPALVPVNQVLGSVTDNAGVWDIGGGMNFALPNTSWKLYLQARYYNGLTTGRHTTLVPITLGFRW